MREGVISPFTRRAIIGTRVGAGVYAFRCSHHAFRLRVLRYLLEYRRPRSPPGGMRRFVMMPAAASATQNEQHEMPAVAARERREHVRHRDSSREA